MNEMKQQPTAEDWIILRILSGWANDMGGLHHDRTAARSVHWLVNKLGKQTIRDMINQLKEEQRNE
jgi:hypothetical protein